MEWVLRPPFTPQNGVNDETRTDKRNTGDGTPEDETEGALAPEGGSDGWNARERRPPRDAVDAAARRFAADFNIRCGGVEDAVGTLSGGNAQKVAIAKVLAANPAVLVLNELTQGVDVGARQEIYALLGELAGKGMAVVLVSSDMTELLGLCRRIAVMRL